MLITLNLKFAHPQLSSCTWKLIILCVRKRVTFIRKELHLYVYYHHLDIKLLLNT